MKYVHVLGNEAPFSTERKTVMINIDHIQCIVASTSLNLWKVVLASTVVFVDEAELEKIERMLYET